MEAHLDPGIKHCYRSLSLQTLAQLSSILALFLERLSLCLATPAEKEHLSPNTSSVGTKIDFLFGHVPISGPIISSGQLKMLTGHS